MTDKNGQDGTKKVMLGSFSDGKKVLQKKLKDGTITTKYQTTHLTGTGWHTDEDATEEMFIDEMQKLIKHHRKLNIRFGIFNLEINMSKNLHWQWYMQMKEKIYFHHFNKALKKLNIKLHFSMYQTGGTNAQEIAKQLNMTVQEVGQHIKTLMRVGLVERHPRKRINGDYSPANYTSTRREPDSP